MIPSDSAAHEAAATFRSLLEADPQGTRAQFEEAREQMRQTHLFVGDDVAPFCFAPAIVSRSRHDPIKKQIARLMRILKRLEPLLLRPRWLNKLGVSEAEQDLIRLPAGFDLGMHVSRVDGFVGPANGNDTGFRIVELNVDSPGGAAYLDAASKIMASTPVWKEFRQRHPGSLPKSCKRILDLLLKAYRLWGGLGQPRIGIADWITVSTVSEFEVLKERFTRAGIETVVVDPRELEFTNGRLRDYDGKPIDLVYRRVLVEDLLAHGNDARALLDAYRAGAVCVVNPFRCKPLTVKSLMAVFHEPEMEELLGRSASQFLRTLVPWTALVEDGPAMERIEKGRDHLVLKPADSWGGQGIYLGWELTDSQWSAAIEEALKGRYVAQEKVAIPQAHMPLARDDGWDFPNYRLDFNPYTFSTGVGMPLIRLAGSDLLNIKAGGQLTVSYVLDC
ncbi:MAG: circularly permuted type 2 ATP-grasp protein [Candidatus Eremiobacteraeota bacterium]|nr:circularly permuted type 2 ATP-grasp protein [Candidatus Eremiobacteraeota bacterium]